jgi:hypothetical protein
VEHNAVPDVEQGHLDGCPDASFPEAVAPDQRRADAHQPATGELDASGAVLRDAGDATAHPVPTFPALVDEAAEKSVAPAPDGQVRDALLQQWEQLQRVAEAPAAAEALCTPVAARSAARSCAAQAVVAQSDERVQRSVQTAARQLAIPQAGTQMGELGQLSMRKSWAWMTMTITMVERVELPQQAAQGAVAARPLGAQNRSAALSAA